MGRRTPPDSTAALLSVVLCVLSWELTAALFAGRWLFGPDWFGPLREWVALGVSVALTAYHELWGRRLARSHYGYGRRPGRSLTAGQAAAVTILMVAAGAFMTWLFSHRP